MTHAMRWGWLCVILAGCTAGEGTGDDEPEDAAPDVEVTADMASAADVGPAADMAVSADMAAPDMASHAMGDDIDMQPEDFDCLLDWTPIRRFYITNKLGRLDETLAVANSAEGGIYPPGTVIQLVPGEAMVKRRPGWSPETNDWEFFFLRVAADGAVTIEDRGTTDVVNQFGGNCLDCHRLAEPQWDFVCEQDHGCDPLPINEQVIRNFQDTDPRCD